MRKEKVKRLLSLGLVVAMTVSMITGCGNSGADNSASTDLFRVQRGIDGRRSGRGSRGIRRCREDRQFVAAYRRFRYDRAAACGWGGSCHQGDQCKRRNQIHGRRSDPAGGCGYRDSGG